MTAQVRRWDNEDTVALLEQLLSLLQAGEPGKAEDRIERELPFIRECA